ncbi:hypothetical protein BC826DRAFT_1097917 [Russula brevipes]|nr:hypothetical protein BC826DRAFT_1097917 [Russula brevipes]
MKYIEIPNLDRLAQALTHEGRIRQVEITPFGPMDKHSTRKTLYSSARSIFVAFPDHEFFDVKLTHFHKEQSDASVLDALSMTLVAPHRAGIRAPRTSPLHAPQIVCGTHPMLYRTLDEIIGLTKCEVFSYVPDIESDPHASDFSDEEDDVKSVGDSDSSDYSGDEPFAFDDYDIDGAAVYHPAFGGRFSHWPFFNRRLKRMSFVSVWACSQGMTRWPGEAADITAPGVQFFSWEGATGAGAQRWALALLLDVV